MSQEQEEIIVTEFQQNWMESSAAKFNQESESTYHFKAAERKDNFIFAYLLKDGSLVDEYIIHDQEYKDKDPLITFKEKLLFRKLSKQALEKGTIEEFLTPSKQDDTLLDDAVNIPLKDLEKYI